MAEASPDSFLEAVERDLNRGTPALVKLFDQECNWLIASNPRSGLLWALEVLAWDCGLLPRVSMVLATLDEKIPKVELGNSPSQKLA